jgi:hypothetical protein
MRSVRAHLCSKTATAAVQPQAKTSPPATPLLHQLKAICIYYWRLRYFQRHCCWRCFPHILVHAIVAVVIAAAAAVIIHLRTIQVNLRQQQSQQHA